MSSRTALRREPPPSRADRLGTVWIPRSSPPSEVSRAPLVNRLRAARRQSVVTIVAPAGYGKTVLLGQWAEREERRFVRIECAGLDAYTLVRRVGAALGGEADDAEGEAAPRGDWIWRSGIPRLAGILASAPGPFVLAFDDAHRLDADAVAVVTALIRHLPAGSLVALAGRTQPLPSLPRLRASGELLELGVEDLAFTRRETRTLLRSLLGTVSEDDLDGVLMRTEGWPAGTTLAALSQRVGTPAGAARAGRDGELSEYLEAEWLASLDSEQRVFLRRTSILGRLSASLCNAVLGRDDSAAVLASLERQAVLMALDRSREWSRLHRTLREQLRRELAELEPRLVAELERRAAVWFEADDDPERALRHWYAAGDVDQIARLIDAVAVELHNDGRDDALVGWVTLLERSTRLEDHPELAVLAARLHAQRAEPAEAERCLDAAVRGARIRTPGGAETVIRARIELVRAAMCADGVESMLVDAEHALDRLPPDDPWRPYGLLLQGTAYALLDEGERAHSILSRAVHASTRVGSTESRALALTQRALLSAADGDRVSAGEFLDAAREAVRLGGLEAYATSALTLAATARFELLHGHSPEAFAALAAARRLLSGLGRGLPWLAVQARLQLAEAEVTLRDAASARNLLTEVDDVLATCPNLGDLRRSHDLLAAELEGVPAVGDGRSVGLTAAELRLVPMLATHLSFREIGARFFLSRNTVKTQAISVYRKLGASSRSEAVLRAHSLGLTEEPAKADRLIQTG